MEALTDAHKYRAWRDALAANGLRLHDVTELQTVRKGDGAVLFAMLRVDARAADGEALPPIVVLRGHFVSCLTLLTARETGQTRLLLVKQRRAATGGWFYEHPSGMVDGDEAPADAMRRELEEETGLALPPDALRPLNHAPLYASPGLLDEGGYFFHTEISLPQAEIDALQDARRGAAHEHERIDLHLASLPDALRLIQNANGLLNIYLYLHATGAPLPAPAGL